MKKNIHKNLRNKIVHFLGIALLMGSIVTSSFLQPMLTASAASDITPQYTTNSNGIVPTNSWTIPGQNTVINHQGGDTTNGWDKKDSWEGTSSDISTSYLKFGTNTSNPDYQIRKYAKETSTPGLYDVYLNVKGNEIENTQPVDIVLVVDMSGSMEPDSPTYVNPNHTDRAQAVRDGVNQFLMAIKNTNKAKYVNVGLVGFASNIVKTVNVQNVLATNQISSINSAISQKFSGGTYTQQGISAGQEMLKNDTSNHKKMMILLTDGVPTTSKRVSQITNKNGTDYATSFSQTEIDQPGFTSQLYRTWWGITGPDSYKVTGGTIQDTWPATLGEALLAKNNGTEIHALGIQIGADTGYAKSTTNPYLSETVVKSRMSLIASNGLYRDANTAANVTEYLNDQAQTVLSQFNTVNQGTISDPLGSQFIYGDDTPTVKSVGSSVVQNLPTVTKSNGSISVSNMNLGKDQEVQIHYQVHLNTESDNFQPDYWYQMNGKTTFTPTKDSNAVEFGVPSAKAPGTAIKVTKQWQELVDSSKRPDSINFNVTRTVNNQSTNWQASGILSKSDNWAKTFKQLSKNNQSVWLPAYDNNGNMLISQ
ncbi:VWA domain-containing protein [Leuconostoc falkenbergense]|uniref:VWA domain-containing protein n=1 Tax=Leuconostoc falkenbergense TaxID=2766470 RepID=UPI001665E2F4|nr:VWA domain-containing protein [Leuconostoc falkenbergense]MCT4404507.1 VWA domain-containing protein [Leuconostoc falkenbergense]